MCLSTLISKTREIKVNLKVDMRILGQPVKFHENCKTDRVGELLLKQSFAVQKLIIILPIIGCFYFKFGSVINNVYIPMTSCVKIRHYHNLKVMGSVLSLTTEYLYSLCVEFYFLFVEFFINFY